MNMKTLTEIFISNPELLEQKEVKELIEQFSFQFNHYKKKHTIYWDKITTLTMSSDFFVKNGKPCEDVVREIHKLSFE